MGRESGKLMETKGYRVAVVGCGAIAPNHVRGILAAGQSLCALCDTEPEHARRLAERFGLSVPVYTELEELLERERPDVLHLCTPHYLHAPVCCAALGRGVNVLCEKPLGISAQDLTLIREAEENSPAMLGVCLQNRYEPNFLRLREIAAREGIAAAFGTVAWKRDADYYASGAWRGRWATEGGGVMINQALHTLDLLQWLCGMPVTVTAHLYNDHLAGEIEVEDTAAGLFRLPDGRSFHLFATTACAGDFPAQIQLITRTGHRYFADNTSLTCDGEPLAGEKCATAGKTVWGSGHCRLIADFYRCLAAGQRFPIDGEEGARVVRLILAMYESGRTGGCAVPTEIKEREERS